ncbi:MAG TPA: DmsC/YnfH family molybdoenzyme membrane anchor subunit, partial [Candidatus Paceibacterota bacterium]|nr:DmsC/YnfH family molybdoenzyme membrane anchor subunit [Candidatus Paceibacterota bacterium]
FLAEQSRLTAVEKFSQRHCRDALPAQAKFYRDLIPLNKPKAGEQYAFEVNLDKCSGCKACVSACHSLNGLDDGEAWREVGLLFSDDHRQPFQQNITAACHHCENPACLSGCPVLAYDKDGATGIVRHLDDQCIGCQYCVMKCPYEVPKYSASRGIVRKCDMCTNRLAVNEAPACVQACPHEAIRITLVETKVVLNGIREPHAATQLPFAPDPAITFPTTRYVSKLPLPDRLLAADHAQVRPSKSHLPLVFMLVLTQLSVGASVSSMLLGDAKRLALSAPVMGAFALGIASFHLGKPLKAWRAFLGWRRSWFSREIIVFSAYMPLAAVYAATFWIEPLIGLQKPLAIAAAITGVLGVVCSAMIYADTHRDFWNAPRAFGKFFGTTLLLGAAATLAVVGNRPEIAALVLIATIAKLASEHRIFRHLVDEETPRLSPLNKTARLLAGQLGLVARLRIAVGLFGGVALPISLLVKETPGLEWIVLAGCIAGELLERFLFFTAVAPRKMPGGIAA